MTDDVTVMSNGTINYISIEDQYINGNGGYGTITDGGIGSHYVTLHFKSKRNHGFNFIVEIFAH